MTNSIDWAATGAMMSGFAAIFGPIAAIGAAIVAARYWTKQKKQELQIQVASELFSAVYRAQQSIENIRSGNSWTHETEQAEQDLSTLDFKVLEGKRKFAVAGLICHNRIILANPQFAKLIDVWPRARAVFGEEAGKICDSILKLIGRIEHHCGLCMRFGHPHSFDVIRAKSVDDDFAMELQTIVSRMEAKFSWALKY